MRASIERCVASIVCVAISGLALACGLALPALTAVAAAAQSAQTSPLKWGPFVDFEAKPGTKRSLGEADIFQPLAQNADTLLFANVRGRFDDQDNREGNAGLGLRHMLASGWNVGVYGYYDRRRTDYDNYFNQATFGGELLGRDWDFRGNVYLPFGERVKNVDSLNTAEISGASVVFHGGEERALRGFDGEVGWRVPIFDAESDKVLRIYAGGYRFDDDVVKAVAGPRLRAELTMLQVPGLWDGARLTLGAEFQHDDVRGSQGFAMARLRVPLSLDKPAKKLTAQESRMVERIVRDVDIVSQAGTYGPAETVTQTASGQTFSVISSGSTTGANLPTAVTNAGANSFVILSGTFNATAPTTLQSGQTLMGAGSLTVRNAEGRTAILTTPGATINSTTTSASAANNVVVTMATNSMLTGMTINQIGSGAANPAGVLASGVSGATIANNTISVTSTVAGTAFGIGVRNSTNVTVSGNTVTALNTGSSLAIAFQLLSSGGATSATVSGNTLSATGSPGAFVYLSGGPLSVTALPGSTGNVNAAGACYSFGTVTGSIGFTNGTTCP